MKNKLNWNVENIYQGCVELMAVHIAAIPKLSFLYYSMIWKENRYSFDDYMECDGTIIFNELHTQVVGALRDISSIRLRDYPEMDAGFYFESADQKTQKFIKEELLQYMLVEFETPRRLFKKSEIIAVPTVTAGFWSEGKDLFTADSLDDFVSNGGSFLNDLCLSQPKRLLSFAENYDLNESELSFAKALIQAKLNPDNSSISKKLITETYGPDFDNQPVLYEQLEGFGIRIS